MSRDYCHDHQTAEPCFTCSDDRAFKQAIHNIGTALETIEELYAKSNRRRNEALRNVGTLAVRLARLEEHGVDDDHDQPDGSSDK